MISGFNQLRMNTLSLSSGKNATQFRIFWTWQKK